MAGDLGAGERSLGRFGWCFVTILGLRAAADPKAQPKVADAFFLATGNNAKSELMSLHSTGLAKQRVGMVCRETLQRGPTVATAVKHRPFLTRCFADVKKAPLERGYKFHNLASPSE